jgi:hypothetical protein
MTGRISNVDGSDVDAVGSATIDPASRVDGCAFLCCPCGRIPTGHVLNVGLHVRERAADADVRIPGVVNANGGDLDPIATVVRLDQQGLPHAVVGKWHYWLNRI